MPKKAPPFGPIAYLTGVFPKESHTFIQREIAAVRAAGITISTCSIRRPSFANFRGQEEKSAYASTFFVLQAAKNPLRLLSAHLVTFFRSPRSWFSALVLAMKISPPGIKGHIWQVLYFIEGGILAAYLHREKSVHLHNHFADSSASVAMLAAQMAGIPFSMTVHGPTEFFSVHKWRLDEKIKRAKFVVAIGHFCRSQLMLFSDPMHWGKIKIIHCGVIPENYGSETRSDRNKHVIFVGRLDSVKGATLLLEAFAQCVSEHPDAKLTFVGDGPERERLEAKSLELGLISRVKFSGYRSQDEVIEILNRASLLALPSFAEGVPVVLMEAMASGIPVLASQIAGIPELVKNGKCGILVPPGHVAGLADGLRTLFAEPKLCSEMGTNGRKIVELDYDVRMEGAKLANLFRESMSKSEIDKGLTQITTLDSV